MPEIKEVVGSSEKIHKRRWKSVSDQRKIVDLKQEVPIPREVEGWLEKLEKVRISTKIILILKVIMIQFYSQLFQP